MDSTIEHLTTPFNDVLVRRANERIDLEVEGATFATWHPRHLMTGYSWDALTAACLLRGDGPPQRILMLGLGGGTVVRQLRAFLPDSEIVSVEIDDGIVDLARRHMGLSELNVEVHIADAYQWLRQRPGQFDAIIDDLFLTGPDDVIRAGVPKGENLSLIREHLAPGAVLIANLITDTGHKTIQRETRAAFSEAFEQVRSVKPPRGLNEILVGGERVQTGAVLRSFERFLHEPYDRARLSELVVRLVNRPRSS